MLLNVKDSARLLPTSDGLKTKNTTCSNLIELRVVFTFSSTQKKCHVYMSHASSYERQIYIRLAGGIFIDWQGYFVYISKVIEKKMKANRNG